MRLSPPLLWSTLIMCFLWFTNNMVYYGLTLNAGKLFPGSLHINTMVSAGLEFLAYTVSILAFLYLGRRASTSSFMLRWIVDFSFYNRLTTLCAALVWLSLSPLSSRTPRPEPLSPRPASSSSLPPSPWCTSTGLRYSPPWSAMPGWAHATASLALAPSSRPS